MTVVARGLGRKGAQGLVIVAFGLGLSGAPSELVASPCRIFHVAADQRDLVTEARAPAAIAETSRAFVVAAESRVVVMEPSRVLVIDLELRTAVMEPAPELVVAAEQRELVAASLEELRVFMVKSETRRLAVPEPGENPEDRAATLDPCD